jgi:hypothetical protein
VRSAPTFLSNRKSSLVGPLEFLEGGEDVHLHAAQAFRRPDFALIVGVLLGIPNFCTAQSAQLSTAEQPLVRIDRSDLCLTNGMITTQDSGLLSIETPSSRAVVPGTVVQAAEIRFRYLGPTARFKALASGEMRRQIGLKLRAQDTCNLLYAMWHIEPDSKLAVLIKRNPGMKTHEQCGAKGYSSIEPLIAITLEKMQPGELHTLHAQLRGEELTLVADGALAWQGQVAMSVADFDGPVGLRTDNGRFKLEYFAVLGDLATQGKSTKGSVARCAPSPGD